MDVDQFMDRVRQAVDAELEKCARDLLNKSQELAPKGKDEVRVNSGVKVHNGGTLANSGFVEARHNSLDDRVFVVVYDTRNTQGGKFNYAIIQHEKPFHHEIGQWKYLETPYKENKEDYKKRILSAIGSGLGNVTIEGGLKYSSKGSYITRKFD